MGRTKKNLQTDKKKGIEMYMAFRNHQDPLYYDSKANDKIFVPVNQDNLSKEQKEIVESFPAADRGEFDPDAAEGAVEVDPIAANERKIQIKQKAIGDKRQERFRLKDDVSEEQSASDQEYDDEEDEEEEISDLAYDSEEEAKEDHKFLMKHAQKAKEQSINEKETKEPFIDVNKEIKKTQKIKVKEGVNFIQYDEYGLPTNDGTDYRKFLSTDNEQPDVYFPAPEEAVQRMLQPTGKRFNIDKEVKDMNEEEREVFAALDEAEDADGNVLIKKQEGQEPQKYEELEDDFLLLANEGEVAIEIVDGDEDIDVQAMMEDDEDVGDEFDNKGVKIIQPQLSEEELALKEYRQAMAALLPPELQGDGQTSKPTAESVAPKFTDQNAADQNFQALIDNEYNEDQIGELDDEDINVEDIIDEDQLLDVVDEFIEDKKLWFRNLHKEYGEKDPEQPPQLIPAKKNIARNVPRQEDVEREDYDEKETVLKKAQMQLNEKFDEDAENYNSSDDYTESDPEDKWDCETIQTTLTNTDNHPGVIKTTRKVKPKNTIQLHKQFKVPLEGLIPIAEEIDARKPAKKSDPSQVYKQVSDDDEVEEENTENKDNEETTDPKKLRKKQVKDEKRAKRKLKKELKSAFKGQSLNFQRQDHVEAGGIKQGVSVKKIY